MYIIYKFIVTGGACPTFFTDGTYEQYSLSSRMSAGPGTPPSSSGGRDCMGRPLSWVGVFITKMFLDWGSPGLQVEFQAYTFCS